MFIIMLLKFVYSSHIFYSNVHQKTDSRFPHYIEKSTRHQTLNRGQQTLTGLLPSSSCRPTHMYRSKSPFILSDTDSTYGWNDAVNTLQHNYKGPLQSAKSFSGIFGNHTSFAITSFAISSDHQNIKFAVDSRIYNYSCVSDALWAKLD